jgi:hypothetical protein
VRGLPCTLYIDVVRSRRFATGMSRGWLAITVQARLASIEQFRRAQGTSSTFDTPTTNLFPSPPPPVLPLGTTFRFCVFHLLPNLIVFPRFEILLRPRKIHLSILRSPGNAFDIRDRTRQLYQRPSHLYLPCRDVLDLCTVSARLQLHSSYPPSPVLEVDICLPQPPN